jgi:hypothetical protein
LISQLEAKSMREEICVIIDGENTTACIVETVLE